MKTIGLIGGMSWESTAEYYRMINEGVKQKLGGLHSAKIVLLSVDFEEVERLQHFGDWDACADILINAAKSIELAGADALLIATNTMHKVANKVANSVTIPLLHIADATAEELHFKGIKKVGLLGTAFTMEQEFYKGRLQQKHNLNVLVPNQPDQRIVHDVIYNELCLGVSKQASKQEFCRIIQTLHDAGAEAVILACTEIGLLIKQQDSAVTLLDTTAIHAAKAVNFILESE